MAWIDATYLQNAVGSSQVTALGLTSGVLTQYELEARSTVLAVLQYAGYPDPGDTLTAGTVTTAFLQKLVAAIVLRDAYALRTGIEISEQTQETISHGVSLLDAVYNKRLPVPGLEPVARDGYGGVKFTPTSGTSARPQIFNLRGTGF